jgi:hypothetical protein
MPDEAREARGHLEFITYAASPAIPHELAAPLLERGVPKEMLGLYRAADELTLLEDSVGLQLVCFGFIAYSQRACLDPRTRDIVALLDMRGGGEEGNWAVFRGNSTIEQFIASVGAVLNRYPFDSPQAVGESDDSYLDRTRVELDRATDDLKAALSAIDPAAMEDPSRFWPDFIDDVQMGNYSADDEA